MSIRRKNSKSRANRLGTAQSARRISTNQSGEEYPHPVLTRSRGELEYVPRYCDAYFLDSCLLDSKIQELRDKLSESQRAANQEKDRLNETINSFRTRDESSSACISTETYVSLTSMSTRQQNHASRTDYPSTPRPTCRRSTQSR